MAFNKKQSTTDFAIAAMEELERNNIVDLLLLKNDQLRNWWTSHKAEVARVEAERVEKERRKLAKEEALAKLTQEEKELLGLVRLPIKKSRVNWDTEDDDPVEAEWEAEYHKVFSDTFKTFTKK